VVTRTIMIIAEKTSFPMIPFERPTDATIKPTSPRLIIPIPTLTDSMRLNPLHLAPKRHPTTLPPMATMTINTVNQSMFPASDRASASSPILMKKIGTRKL